MRLTAKHPARKDVLSLPTYHTTKGAAVGAVDAVLNEHNIELSVPPMEGDEGIVMCPLRPSPKATVICECCATRMGNDEYENCLVLSWYTMASGKVELTAYIS